MKYSRIRIIVNGNTFQLAMLLLQKLDPFVKQGADVNTVPSEIMQRYSSSLLA